MLIGQKSFLSLPLNDSMGASCKTLALAVVYKQLQAVLL